MKMEPAPDVPVYGIVVEKDVDVPMRDGARLKADVFRPDDAGTFPAILNLGPYQKDKLWVPPGNLEEKPNPLMNCFIWPRFPSPCPASLSPAGAQETLATSWFLVAKSGQPNYIPGHDMASECRAQVGLGEFPWRYD